MLLSSPPLSTRLETPRLTLRPARTADVTALLAAQRRNEAHLRPWTPIRPDGDRRITLASAARDVAIARRSWRRDDAYTFFLFAKEERPGTLVGRITIGKVIRGAFQNAFLGYWLDVAEQNKGLMTEAVRSALDFAFGPAALHRVQAGVMPKNARSMRVLEKLGFRREGISTRYLQIAGRWEDHVIFAMTGEEWSERAQ